MVLPRDDKSKGKPFYSLLVGLKKKNQAMMGNHPPSSRGFGAYRAGAVFGGTSGVLASARDFSQKPWVLGRKPTMVYGKPAWTWKQCYDGLEFKPPKRNKQKEGELWKKKNGCDSFWMWIDILIKRSWIYFFWDINLFPLQGWHKMRSSHILPSRYELGGGKLPTEKIWKGMER